MVILSNTFKGEVMQKGFLNSLLAVSAICTFALGAHQASAQLENYNEATSAIQDYWGQGDGLSIEPQATSYFPAENGRIKVQMERIAGGAHPPAGWVYQNAQNGNNPGFQGSGYYYWRNELGTGRDTKPVNGLITLTIYISEGGTYSFRMRSARDSDNPGESRNDIYLKVNENAANYVPAGTPALKLINGFAKFYRAQHKWGYSFKLSPEKDMPADQKPESDFVLGKGFHTITFAGRSYGYHMDFFTVYKKGMNPPLNAPDTKMIAQ
jgi:hypothetical protein